MKNITKQIITVTLVITMLFTQSLPTWADDIPTPPAPPEAPSAPAAPSAPPPPPSAPTAPTAPTPPSAPAAPSAPTPPTATPTPTQTQQVANTNQQSSNNQNSGTSTQQATVTPTPIASNNTTTPNTANTSTGITNNSNVGDTTIDTGDATNEAAVLATGNNNLSATGSTSGTGATVTNAENGAGSTNNSSATLTDNNTTTQNNSANVGNNLTQSTTTGDNSASRNTGGDNTITTGDANTTGTVITAVNTNVDGVAVAEFNIADDHRGDLVLDFGANCISGCGGAGNLTAQNIGNGDSSQNTADVTDITNNNTFQNNDATVGSNLTLSSDSGNNRADSNTDGNNTITTGDANVAANVLTFANNNLAGNVLFGVVNIFGDLVGDIILPDDPWATCTGCGANVTAANTGNGDSSQNNSNVSVASNNNTFQNNDAVIENNLLLDANTGDNQTSRNTGGNNTIDSGNTNVEANVLNIANSNVTGGDWWLVLVNEAGNWIGKILGAPDGSNYAGSSGTQFTVNEFGEITATNAGNGVDSTNNTSVNQTTNNTTDQSNVAHIVNNLNLFANTGDNSASRNTGGTNSITTGDAEIIANLVNFVNNNISGNGRLFVTVVNVFGSWVGDVVAPGQKKETKSQDTNQTKDLAIGGQDNKKEEQKTEQDIKTKSSDTAGDVVVEKTPTPTKSPLAAQVSSTSQTQGIKGITSGGSDDKLLAYNVATSKPMTLGVSSSKNAEKNKVTLNLAWLLILTPLILGSIIIGKKKTLLLHIVTRKAG